MSDEKEHKRVAGEEVYGEILYCSGWRVRLSHVCLEKLPRSECMRCGYCYVRRGVYW